MQHNHSVSLAEREAEGEAAGGTSRPHGKSGGATAEGGLKAGFFDQKKKGLPTESVLGKGQYPPHGEQQLRGAYANAGSLIKSPRLEFCQT